MKKIFTLFAGFLLAYNVQAQTKPIIGSASKTQVNKGIGTDFIIISGLSNGDPGTTQPITVTAQSSNSAILEVSSVVYQNSNSYAIINLAEKGTSGSATITLQVTDADGTTSKDFTVQVGQFYKKGVNWSVYDIVFWTRIIPLTQKPVLDSILTEVVVPTDENIYNRLPLTVGPEAGLPKHDFFTSMFKGYLVPPATGEYTFTLTAQDMTTFRLSTDENFNNVKELIEGGSNTPKDYKITLQGGKYYAFYVVNWQVHDENMKLEWVGPGITKSVINSDYMFPNYDSQKPTSPLKVTLPFTGITNARVAWNKSTDNQKLKDYNIYLDGIKIASTTDTMFTLPALTPSTSYSVFVTSTDVSGNESMPSTSISFTTFGQDNINPTPPTKIITKLLSDVSTSISWSGAKDEGSQIAGYKVYLDNELFNPNELITDTTAILKVLTPLTNYKVQIEAVDAGNNVSAKSEIFEFKTLKFNPLVASPGTGKARASFTTLPIGRNEGFGISAGNAKYADIPAAERKLLEDLRPAVQRWGDLGKNVRSFIDYSGPGKKETYAGFMKRCNIMNSYCAMVIGVQNETDWMKDSTTFTKFMEYLNGPATTEQGARRAAEGISEPLLAQSKGLIIDLGTEVWGGGGLHGAEIGANYPDYAKWARRMAKIIKASSYYDASKVFITYSGRNPSPMDSYGLNDALLVGDKGEVDWMSVSGYLGGNLTYDPLVPQTNSEVDYYKNGIQRMAYNLKGSQDQLRLDFRHAKRYLPKNFYESNMTTPDYNGRLGQAIIMTDYMLSVQEWGTTLPSIFHLTGGEWRITEPSENYKKRPLFHTASLVNNLTVGNMLNSEVATQDKIFNDEGEVIKLEPVGFNVFTQAGNYSVVLTSRDFENDYQVQLNLPDGLLNGSTARKYLVTGEDFNTKDAIIDSSTINFNDSLLVTVPKHSMVILTFKGTDLKQAPLPLGYTQFGKPVGVLDMDAEAGPNVVLYPNPVKGDLNIHCYLGDIDYIKVSNVVGETIYEEFSNKDHLTFSMDGLPSGIYLVQVNSKGKSIRKKVIKY